MTSILFRALALASAFAAPALADTLYVDSTLSSGSNDGSSWEHAFQGSGGLQVALQAASNGDRIFVRTGTYLPSADGNRERAFELRSGVEVYGSFLGFESEPDERPAFDVAPSTLSGDLWGNDAGPSLGLAGGTSFTEDNSFNVVRASGVGSSAVLDGFRIVAGNSLDLDPFDQADGGGLLCAPNASPTIRNCHFQDNYGVLGGAVHTGNGGAGAFSSSPVFLDCTFEGNHASGSGGACYLGGSQRVAFERCEFIGNTGFLGGALFMGGEGTVVNNCVFWNNVATATPDLVADPGGGAIYSGPGKSRIRSSTFVGNVAMAGPTGAIWVAENGNQVKIGGCIVWGNQGAPDADGDVYQVSLHAKVTYSIVEGGFDGEGVVDSDPLFRDASNADFRLLPGSPAIDAASNPQIPANTVVDFGGGSRLIDDPLTADTGVGEGAIIDMGAFEYGSGLAVETVRAGTRPNPIAFLPGQTSAPLVGATWDPVIDHTSFATDALSDFALISGSAGELSLGAAGTLLCDLSDLLVIENAAAPGAPFAIEIPDSLPLVGLALCAQGGSMDNAFQVHLANALDIQLGGN